MFFWGMLSDPRSSGEFNKNRESGRKPTNPRTDTRNWRVQNPHVSRAPPNDRNTEPKRNHEGTLMKQAPPKPNRPSVDESGPGRPKGPSIDSAPGRSKPCVKPKVDNEIKFQQKSDNRPIQKKPMPPQQEVHIAIWTSIYLSVLAISFLISLLYFCSSQKLNPKNDASVRIKLEAAKRKLQERYQEAENGEFACIQNYYSWMAWSWSLCMLMVITDGGYSSSGQPRSREPYKSWSCATSQSRVLHRGIHIWSPATTTGNGRMDEDRWATLLNIVVIILESLPTRLVNPAEGRC